MAGTIWCGMLAALVACVATAAAPDEVGTRIDFPTFGQVVATQASVWDGIPVQEVSRRFDSAPRRLYVSAMLGPSFANVWSPADPDLSSGDTILAAGGALGVAFERTRGRLRLEVEAAGRDTYDGGLFTTPDVGTVLTSNWSMLANLWRDVMITDRFGIYAGAGIGGGGYVLADRFPDGSRDVLGPGSALAWQGGGGLLWEITERLTFDVGYRYFAIDTIQQPFVPSGFGASELMFTLRLYEPFRAWRR